MEEIRSQQGKIDWSKVDVAEATETPTDADDAADDNSAWRTAPGHFWWTLELLGMAICLVIWLFTRQLTPPLMYAFAALALIGVFLALAPLAAGRVLIAAARDRSPSPRVATRGLYGLATTLAVLSQRLRAVALPQNAAASATTGISGARIRMSVQNTV